MGVRLGLGLLTRKRWANVAAGPEVEDDDGLDWGDDEEDEEEDEADSDDEEDEDGDFDDDEYDD